MIEVKLVWPNAKLSPNVKQHWSVKASAVKKYRRECFVETKFQVPNPVRPVGNLTLELEFCPPQRREYDRDNLVARMKAGLDGMADALGINDKEFTTLMVKVADPQKGGFVMVRITGENDAKENQRPDGQGR